MDAEKYRAILSENLFRSARDLRLGPEVYISTRGPEAYGEKRDLSRQKKTVFASSLWSIVYRLMREKEE